jgi:hypothetical protein
MSEEQKLRRAENPENPREALAINFGHQNLFLMNAIPRQGEYLCASAYYWLKPKELELKSITIVYLTASVFPST